jgi:hypothetical protein
VTHILLTIALSIIPNGTSSRNDLNSQVSDSISKSTQHASQNTITTLDFREFFIPASSELKPTPKLLSLNGKRVRLVGFMAQMEEPLKGAFYLCPRPVFADESGGGTADLPPETVRVIMRSAKNREVQFMRGALEVEGILEVGNHLEDDGQISSIRLLLDEAPPRNSSSRTSRTSTRTRHH